MSIRLGRIAGIPVGVNWSVVVIFGLLTWELAAYVFPSTYGGTRVAYWVWAVVAAALFFGSLLAHEASHAVVARHFGVGVRSITLWLFGGVALLEGEALTPGADFTIAAVGPGMSILLAALFGALQLVLEHLGVHGLAVSVASWLWEINLLLAAFNLIPAAPLDGGRILRSGLWRVWRDRDRAAVLAARVGLGFGILLVLAGCVELARGSALGLWPAFLGWFLFSAARSEEGAAHLRERIEGLSVADVMVQPPPMAPSAMTVAEVLAGHAPWRHGEAAALVSASGWLDGVVTADRIRAVAPDARPTTRLGDIALPLGAVPVSRPEEPMPSLLGKIYAAGGAPALVLDSWDRLAGVVTLADVDRVGRLVGARRGAGAGRG